MTLNPNQHDITQSEQLFKRALQVSPGGVHSPVRAFRGVGGSPLFIRSARRALLTDVDGHDYIDFCLSWGPFIFGHQDEEIHSAVSEALTRGWSYGAAEPYSLELAELITGRLKWVEKIRFVNSGTEAVLSALRLARAATQRNLIVKFDGCYHGHVDSLLVRAGSGLAEMATPDSAGVSKAVAAETLVIPLNDLAALEHVFDQQGKSIAAIIVEPVPANMGLLLQKEGFLKHLVRIAHQAGALVIFDEVITGFRILFGGMAEKTGITPDLVTYGKIIGGGFPVGAYGGKKELMDLVAPSGPVYQAGTLSANPVAMGAGLATLKKLIRENPYPRLEQETRNLALNLEKIAAQKSALPLKVQTEASLFWLVLGAIKAQEGFVRTPVDIPSTQKEAFSRVFHSLLQQGIYLAPSGYEVSFLSTAHETQHLDAFLNAFECSL
jgi:glutamate-1-semialdehyde 2,1-aminomutase